MGFTCPILRIFFVLAAAAFTLPAQLRDDWLKMERKGAGFAYIHLTVSKTPEGNLRYETESHVKVDVLGQNQQEITVSATYLVDAELRPVSSDWKTQSPSRSAHFAGARSDGGMTITPAPPGNGTPRTIDLKNAYFDVVLTDLIARRSAEKQFSVRLFDGSDSSPSTARVEILSVTDSEITATVTSQSMTSRYRIGRNGQTREMLQESIGYRTFLTDATNARNIAPLATSDGFSLMVRSSRQLANVYDIRRAQLRIRWKKVAFEEFRLEDNRQKLIRHDQSGDQFEAVVETTAPSLQFPGRLTPAPQEILTRYLGSDDFIKPQDAAIRKQAAAIVGETTDPVEKVRKLVHWVHANVDYDLVAETLSGPEVLEHRKGKCSEFATLFASLARAAGIPARIALGVSYGSTWVGHMWNEVWVGEWVGVDATGGDFITGPSRLKFVDSAKVEGTFAVRYGLIDNLEIEILQADEVVPQTSLQSGITGSTYVSGVFLCRIAAPDSSWTLTEKTEGASTTLLMKSPDGEDEFALVLISMPPGTEAAKVMDYRLGALAKMVTGYRLIESGTAQVAGHAAARAVFAQTSHAGTTRINENLLLVDGTKSYLFAWIVPEEAALKMRPILLRILESFELIRP